MQRERLVPLVVAILAVLALAVGAATLDSATNGPLTGQSEGPGLTDGEQGEMDLGGRPPAEQPDEQFFPTWLAQLVVGVLLLLGLVGILYRIWTEGLDFVKTVALVAFAVTAVLLLLYYLLEWLTSGQGSSGENGMLGELRTVLPGGGGGNSEVSQVVTDPSVVMLAVIGVVLLAVVAVVLRSLLGSDGDEAPTDPDLDDPEPSVQEVGAAAGRAADRIDATGDVENAIYRAWREMTDPLDLSRETSTPGEFAAAAVDAGMSRDDVGELTRLFERTRYGGVAVDEGREQRATTALRRIERTYGDDR
ncbi:DUF4129 domain-containing protein [Halomarina salina]|uniref:DUF4129 domain-containing protein n=1 Tax=Halomarina salina TaxID=1872699 RepID=A0ABD5RJX1_9EURY